MLRVARAYVRRSGFSELPLWLIQDGIRGCPKENNSLSPEKAS
jgi:hypothetical protein